MKILVSKQVTKCKVHEPAKKQKNEKVRCSVIRTKIKAGMAAVHAF